MESSGTVVNEHNVALKVTEAMQDILTAKRVSKILELEMSRAIALCCVKLLADETQGTISAVDVVIGFGLSALQWLKHIKQGIKVTANVAKGMEQELSMCVEGDNEMLNVRSEDPHVLLHSQKFKFVYVEAVGSAVTYLDAALRSVNHEGLLCVTCTDIAILNNKSPETAVRLYGSKLLKNEYCGEMAVRVIVANALRAAARWGKGLRVELCAATEFSVTVVFRVLRGSKHVEPLLPHLCTLSHCLNCQARRFNEDTPVSVNDNNQLCHCGEDVSLSALTQLGPMWSGSILNPSFIDRMLSQANAFGLSEVVTKTAKLLLAESVCCQTEAAENRILARHKDKIEQDDPPAKKQKFTSEDGAVDFTAVQEAPAFYFDFQHHSVKGGNPPKLVAVIERLRGLGHRASKTHFGPRCVRTSASLQQFNDLLQEMWEETSKAS